jgi:hypothetical protein
MFEFNSSCLLHASNFTRSSSGRPFVHAVFYGIFLCIYVSSLAGGRKCSISRYCDLLKIKIFYVYIKLLRTIILTSAQSITNTFKRIPTSKCLCKVQFCFLVNILRKQDEAEWALDSTHKPRVVRNQLWVKGLGRYECDMDWHLRYSLSLMITEMTLKCYVLAIHPPDIFASPRKFTESGSVKALG